MRKFVALAAVGVVFCVVLGAAFVTFARHDPQSYVEAVDGLGLPSTWTVRSTEVMSQGGTPGCIEAIDLQCPRVTRYLEAPGILRDLLEQARTAVVSGGYADVKERHPECATPTSGPTCGLSATKPGFVLYLDIYPSGSNVDGIAGLGGTVPTVRIIATRR